MSVETMKLSAAIRAGAKLRPQATGDYIVSHFDEEGHRIGFATCVLGAAAEAIKPDLVKNYTTRQVESLLVQRGPQLDLYSVDDDIECPACGVHHRLYAVLTIHLNDNHRWTREQIADWLEGQGL